MMFRNKYPITTITLLFMACICALFVSSGAFVNPQVTPKWLCLMFCAGVAGLVAAFCGKGRITLRSGVWWLCFGVCTAVVLLGAADPYHGQETAFYLLLLLLTTQIALRAAAFAVQMAKKIRLKSNSSGFSQTQLYYHKKFLDILASPNNCKSISDVLTKIKTIESEIYFSNMENNEKEALLVTYAIGRNSLEFWLGCDKKLLRPRLKSGGESFDFLGWWNEYVTPAICAIVETDFYGAASGALGGAVLGATSGTVILPGVGTITGTIVGTVEGAAYGAVYSSLIGGISYYFTVSN